MIKVKMLKFSNVQNNWDEDNKAQECKALLSDIHIYFFLITSNSTYINLKIN